MSRVTVESVNIREKLQPVQAFMRPELLHVVSTYTVHLIDGLKMLQLNVQNFRL